MMKKFYAIVLTAVMLLTSGCGTGLLGGLGGLGGDTGNGTTTGGGLGDILGGVLGGVLAVLRCRRASCMVHGTIPSLDVRSPARICWLRLAVP